MRRFLGLIIFFVLIPSFAFGFVDYVRIIGYNASAVARGGTDVAIATLPSSLNLNPAGLTQLNGFLFESTLGLIHPTGIKFKYTETNDVRYGAKDEDDLLIAPGVSFGYHPKGQK